MRFIHFFTFISLFILTSVGVFSDDLLFYSDQRSLIHFIAGLIVLSFVVLSPLWGAATFFLKKRLDPIKCVVWIVFFNLFFFAGDYFLQKYKRLDIDLEMLLNGGLLLGAIFGALVIAYFIKIDSQIQKKMKFISGINFVGVLGIFIFCYITSPLSKKSDEPNKESIVLFISDGLPTYFLSAYNPQAQSAGLDDFISKSTVFKKAYSNLPYTGGFFKVLYSGQKDLEKKVIDGGILAKIQKKYPVFINTYHFNAFPNTMKVLGTYGLRSYFLTQYYSWIPKVLNVPYHVNRYWGPVASERLPIRPRFLHAFMNHSFFHRDQVAQLHTQIFDEIEFFSQMNQAFLYIVLLPKSYSPNNPDINQLWRKPSPPGVSPVRDAQDEIKKAGYLYDDKNPNHLAFVDQEMGEFRVHKNEQFKSFELFFKKIQKLQEDGKKLKLVLTADHGFIMERGKVWYGRHFDEEVTRVPLIVYPAKSIKEDSELTETTDLSFSLVDHFVPEHSRDAVAGKSISIFSDQIRKTSLVTSVTQPIKDKTPKEYYVTVYNDKNEKKIFHAQGRPFDEKLLMAVEDPEALPPPEKTSFKRNVTSQKDRELLESVMRDYGIYEELGERQAN